jgi:thiamine pyrophosphokinase
MKLFLLLVMFFWHGALQCTPWVIVANGPSLSLNELQDSLQDRKIVILDGAVNRFKSLPLRPDCILGDFDSVEDPVYWGILATFSEIDERSSPYRGNFGIMIVPAKDQNFTDLEKGILYCDAVGASSIHIVQATGGRMDHTLGNLGTLRKYYRSDRELIILTEKEQIFDLHNDDISIEAAAGEYCAVMGYPQAVMTTSGLAYNVSEYPLQLGIQESTCNTIIDPKATISIQGEALIILPKSSVFKIVKADAGSGFK